MRRELIYRLIIALGTGVAMANAVEAGPPGLVGSRLRYRRLPGLAPVPPLGSVPACAFPFPGPSCAEAPSGPPTLLQPKLFPVAWLPSVRTALRLGPVEAFASWRLSRGIAFPSRVALLGTTGGLAEPGLGDMLSTT